MDWLKGWEDVKWDVLNDYYKNFGLVRHQIETYNHFILFDIDKIIRDEPHLKVERKTGEIYSLKFFGSYIEPPCMANDDRTRQKVYPRDTRLKDLTYESNLYVQAEEQTIGHDGAILNSTIHNRILLAKIPTMVKSVNCNLYNLSEKELFDLGEDPSDPGGYFIVHGKERVIVGQMRNAYNKPFTYWKNNELFCELRSMSDETGHSVLIVIKISQFNILINIPHVKEWIPLAVVFKAMCIESMEDYEKFISKDHIFKQYYTRMHLDVFDMNVDQALQYIQEKASKPDANHILNIELFPHLGICSTLEQRQHSLSLMARTLFNVDCGNCKETDRDSYENKRVEFCGYLCSDLFKLLYKKFLKILYLTMQKQHRIELNSLSKQAGITNGLSYSFATGNWGVQRNNYIRTGVCQIPHPKVSTVGMISAMRRVVIPNGKEGKNNKIRQLHPSSIFFICPHETPEGQSIGIVLNIAALCHVSRKISHLSIKPAIDSIKMNTGNIKVFINGIYIRSIDNAREFYNRVRELRLRKMIAYDVTFYYDDYIFEILSDGGRFIRPLLNIQQELFTFSKHFQELQDCGIIEYMCPNQIETLNIAINLEYALKYGNTSFVYLELEPTTIMGVVAAQIPFSNHTQSPRVCYQSSMAKQAIGHITNITWKMETTSYTLDYPQKTLCDTKLNKAFNIEESANGINALVAIACYSGYNQEDSMVINKSALDRGLFCTQVLKTFVVEERLFVNVCHEKICNPPYDKRKLHMNYEHLDENGIVKLKTFVKKDDVIVGKIVNRFLKKEIITTDESIVIKNGEEGQVVKIVKNQGKNGFMLKIMISSYRIPEIGDKLCSNIAQKGTCGMILNQEDMPFLENGMVPDIIINPHCIPSRMTINQIMSCIMGKIKCITRKNYSDMDGTPFENKYNFSQLCDLLQAEGMRRDGTEIMYNGMTGERIKTTIFFGPTYYHRLKHLVSDKIHARAQGQVTSLTRQPNCGRSKNGGLRIGEMEKDSLLVHGVSKFINERMFESSDFFYIYVCSQCKIISANIKECHVCGKATINKCNIPYACKLLLQELNGMGIKTLLEVK